MKYNREELIALVAISQSVTEILRKLGRRTRGSSHTHLARLLLKYEIDTSHFVAQRAIITKRKHWTEILVDGKDVYTPLLRRAMIESGIEYKCHKCYNGPQWLGEPLVLQIEHKNGDSHDNKPNNLEFLCPNCHTQTLTHSKIKTVRGKQCTCGNKLSKKATVCLDCARTAQAATSQIPEPAVLEQLIWEMPAINLAIRFGVSGKTIEKWCRKYGLAKPGPGYWQRDLTKPTSLS